MRSRRGATRAELTHAVRWASAGSVVTLLLIAAAWFPLQAVAVGTVALALATLAGEIRRAWQDVDR